MQRLFLDVFLSENSLLQRGRILDLHLFFPLVDDLFLLFVLRLVDQNKVIELAVVVVIKGHDASTEGVFGVRGCLLQRL